MRSNLTPHIPFTCAAIFLLSTFLAAPLSLAAPGPQRTTRASRGLVTLEADQQRKEGDVYHADGHVDVVYQNTRLRADHAEYNEETRIASVRGHVQFDHESQHLEADHGSYNLLTGKGRFYEVHGAFAVQRRPSRTLLISQNPISFVAEVVDRLDEDNYTLVHGWFTVCDPKKPTWKFYASKASIHVDHMIRLENSTFHLLSIPILYLPYATAPASKSQRQSGFLIPTIGSSSQKGFILGDAFYWAPTEWFDTTLGAEWLSKRGYSQSESFRARPWENVSLEAYYHDVKDSGLPGSDGTRGPSQGGHDYHVGFNALLSHGWRAVADLNGLSSLTYRLVFSSTYSEAVNSEVLNTAFLANNFRGFNLSLAALSYKDFISISPQTDVFLRTAPELRFGSVEQAPWQRWPVYFSFQAFEEGLNRQTTVTGFETPSFVQRTEFAPTVTIPLHWGQWLGITPSFTLRTTRYGGQIRNGTYDGQSFVRTTEEFSLDFRPPSLDRIWSGESTSWKHTIEPDIQYHLVNGVQDFARFIRFDEDDTITDTNDVEYSLTQRLFRKDGSGDVVQLAKFSVAQKYFFDPTFGGAIVPGARNVFQAFDSLTPFAFAEAPRRFSPLIADLLVSPGSAYDAEFRADYDPVTNQFTAIGALLKLKPYGASYLTLADFSTINLPQTFVPTLPYRSNQVRVLLGYGDINRHGWNSAVGLSYDFTQNAFQNQFFQISYNGSCCGIGFEYGHFSLANVRNENQFRLVLLIANIGSVGNLRRQEKIF
jgi:LPS-assembly protein